MLATAPDLLYEEGFVPDPGALYNLLLYEVHWDERMRARKTASFGVSYDYSGMSYEAVPMHPDLLPIIDRLEARLGFPPNNCLVNYYADGNNTMGFHSDASDNLAPGTGVAIVSLGAARTLTFQSRRGGKVQHEYRLQGGSLLYMPPEVQDRWRHGVLPEPGAGGRISLTFRLV